MDWSKLDLTGPFLHGLGVFISAAGPWLLVVLVLFLLKEFLIGKLEKHRRRRK